MFIERVTHEIGKGRRVRVATSDGMEQVIILGHGALRVSARMFHEEVQEAEKEIRRYLQGNGLNLSVIAWQRGRALRNAKGPLLVGAVAAGDWGLSRKPD